MRAVVHDRYGPPAEVLSLRDDVPVPVCPDDGALIRVVAASVNPPDWAGVHGIPLIVRLSFGMRRPKRAVRGSDMAGVVEAVGKDVTSISVGDGVFGSGSGAFGEYGVAAEIDLAPKPANVTFEQAAAVPMSALTALQGLRDVARVQPGQRVLVNGAGGGIGTFAVQMAKGMGAEVTGVCGPSKCELVRSLGADHVIDYSTEDYTAGDARYDVVLDNVLDHSLTDILRVVEPGGILIPNGGQFYKRVLASTGVILVKGPLLSMTRPQNVGSIILKHRREDMLELAAMLESGALVPVIGATYPLAQTAQAIDHWGEGHSSGKTVVVIDG